jgi:phosphoglycolate phosphatase-like HAD superfamily hydrolase
VTVKPRVVLFDVDGTLMLNTGGRSFYDWDRVGEDTPNEAIVELADALLSTGLFKIVVMSGRDEVCYEATAQSLERQGVFFAELIMRKQGDNRPDEIVKEELYRDRVEPRYDVAFVVDDRDKVVRMWREVLGLTCLQVAPGDF